jgi:integrase
MTDTISEYLNETPDGRWQARLTWTEGGERRFLRRKLGRVHRGRGRPRAGHLSEPAAWERVAELRAELERSLGMTTEQRTERAGAVFEDLALAWLADAGESRGRPWAPSTRRGYQSVLGQTERGGKGHVLPELGHLTLAELTDNRLRAWWKGLGGLNPRNANMHLTVVRRIFAWATEDGRWGRVDDPTVGIVKRAERDTSGEAPRFFEPHELDLILSAARAEHARESADRNRRGRMHVSAHDADVFALLANTGMRRGEVLALRVGDVDLDDAEPSVTIRNAISAREVRGTKTHRTRRVPITEQAREILERHCAGRPADAFVFPGGGGGPMDADALSRRFLRARDSAGFAKTGLTLHDLRHSFGSLLARAGCSQPEIKSLLGHAKLETTEIYLHHRPRAGDAARLSRALNGKRGGKRLRAVS